jgi:hypothetical protein
MNCRSRILVNTFLIVFAWSTFAPAGDIITTEFKAGSQKGRIALAHLTNKGVVAEFLDLNNTGVGKSIGFLIWREILTAISDQSGAGVIIAHPPGESRIVDMLKANYHLAAVDIAKYQNAPMVLWGIAQENADKILISSHLSLIPEIQTSDLSLNVNIPRFDMPGWKAEIVRTRFNFGLVESSRSKLFNRPIIAKKRTPLKVNPNKEARTIQESEDGRRYQAVDMENEYFKVILENGSPAYLNIWDVDVPPKYVEANRTNIRLRTGPGTNHREKRRVPSFKGSFQVLDMRYSSQHGLWYQISFDGDPVWVAGFLVRPRFSVPAVHFMAGVYRFRAQNFDDALREFQMFSTFAKVEETNTSLATAYQLIGISSLMSKNISLFDVQAFSKAIKLTPYDPSAYNLRAVSRVGRNFSNHGRMDGILSDLNQALKLDRRNKRALDLLHSFGMFIERSSGEVAAIFFDLDPETIEKYDQIKARYTPR